MGDNNDDAQNVALAVLAGVVALVIAGVIALAVSRTMGAGVAAATPATAASTPDAPAGPERVYFELGSDALPVDAQQTLARVADAARANAGAAVLISGFHDASGDAAQNADLAKRRAQAVRHALEANGVAPERLVLDKPALTAGGADAREARRVELRLQ